MKTSVPAYNPEHMYGHYVVIPDGAELPDESTMHRIIASAIELAIAIKPDRIEGLEIILKDWDKLGPYEAPVLEFAGKKTVGFKARFIKD